MNSYTSDFQQLPLNLVYSCDDQEDQLSIFNNVFVDSINTHAPLRRVNLTSFLCKALSDKQSTKV